MYSKETSLLPGVLIYITGSGLTPQVLYRLRSDGSVSDNDEWPSELEVNDWFFNLRITPRDTFVTLVQPGVMMKRNGVGSGLIRCRESALCISVQIPRYYAIAGGETVYDVAMEVRHYLLTKCFRPLPGHPRCFVAPARLPGEEDLHKILSGFRLEGKEMPHRPMTGNKRGFVRTPRFEEFFRDVQYPEFQEYSDIWVASHGALTPSPWLADIPRCPHWKLTVNGHPAEWPHRESLSSPEVIIENPDYDSEWQECEAARIDMEALETSDVCRFKKAGYDFRICRRTEEVRIDFKPVDKTKRLRVNMDMTALRGFDPELVRSALRFKIGNKELWPDEEGYITLVGRDLTFTLRVEMMIPGLEAATTLHGDVLEVAISQRGGMVIKEKEEPIYESIARQEREIKPDTTLQPTDSQRASRVWIFLAGIILGVVLGASGMWWYFHNF